MINRIFKTILVLSIVLGITLPSNAAVSVSDGSAFVTKAEFAADLNNLSNRMAQLENSLDAKIDSLVSSYLTRNGIWNGAKQTMNSSWTSIRYGFRAGATYVANYTLFYESSGWTLRNSATGSSEAMMTRREVLTYPASNIQGTLVDNCDKTGLAFLMTSLANQYQGDTRCYTASVNRSNAVYFAADHFRFIYNASIIYSINNVEKARVNANLLLGAAGIYLSVPPMQTGSVLFFVNKGDSVKVALEVSLNKDSGTAFANTLALCSTAQATDNQILCSNDYNIDDFQIY